MKKLFNSSALAAIVLLYIFALSVGSHSSINQVNFSNPDENTSGYITNQSAHLYSHTSQSVESVFNFTRTSFPDSRKIFKAFVAIVMAKGNILEQKFVQFTFAERNFPIPFTKPDIVYPFHYFL